MRGYEAPAARPSAQEQLLIALSDGAYDTFADGVTAALAEDRSPNTLSVVRPDLLFGFAETFLANNSQLNAGEPAGDTRTEFFEATMAEATQGDPAAISALPKFATSTGELVGAMEMTLDHRDPVAEWRNERPYVQLIGSFNPQHVGHRTTMKAVLEAAGPRSSVTAQVVADHPVKKDSLPPYEGRYRQAERYTYQSTLIDPTRVTVLDVPVDSGLSKTGATQIELLADIAGDPDLRWLVGSDKFMSDVKTARLGKEKARAITRFREPRMHLYVARRAVHDRVELEDSIDFISERFGTKITVVDEPQSELVLGASASLIRQLRAEGKAEEADRIQFADLPALSGAGTSA